MTTATKQQIAARTAEAGERHATEVLRSISKRVLWLSAAIVDVANRREPLSELKVGGHQASSASMVDIMVALWFHGLSRYDRVSVKPHAAPVLHAINYLLGDLPEEYLGSLRSRDGLQSYPSRLKDPDTVDFSTGSVGIGATAALWAAVARRYAASRAGAAVPPGRFISLLGDAELDEGAVWEAVADPMVASLGELLWVVDLNRQSLDRVIPDIQIERLSGMFKAAGWQVITLKWGRRLTQTFGRPGGEELRQRLEEMPNEEYQRMLRAPADEISERLLSGQTSPELAGLVAAAPAADLSDLVRDLGGHDLGLLVETLSPAMIATDRPTVVFAYTIKGRGLPTEGHPNNHSVLLRTEQMNTLAKDCGADPQDPWRRFDPSSVEGEYCARRSEALERSAIASRVRLTVPTSLGRRSRKPLSTQAAFGRVLVDLVRSSPETAARVVTCSPDVASSTSLGGWINKVGVWTIREHHDWFADDTQRLLRWAAAKAGQHIELGIAEVNLVSLLGELGATWSRWGERLIPIGTLYDPFVTRALEPWSYGIYAGGQSILVGTPSGVTLAPEGGAHQSITTPSIGVEQPGCVAWEPAFAQDLEWCLLHAMSKVGIPSGTSSYFRLSTRPVDPELACLPDDPVLLERRRRQAIAGGYRLRGEPGAVDVNLVGVGAMMPEVIEASDRLEADGVVAGVICLTSPDLLFQSFQRDGGGAPGLLDMLFPAAKPVPMVTVHDGHPHTLAFLSGAAAGEIRCLGVTKFGQSSTLADAYAIHGLDVASIVDAALTLLRR